MFDLAASRGCHRRRRRL